MKRIGIISDTHSYMDDRIVHHLKNCTEVWHAGDIGTLRVTDAIAEVAPLRAVYGNIDNTEIRSEFPLNVHFTCEGIQVYMTHIAGKPGNYPARVLEEIKTNKPALFICGHSHICVVKQNPYQRVLHVNPGAAGKHGFHKVRTLVRLSIEKGRIFDLEVVELGSR